MRAILNAASIEVYVEEGRNEKKQERIFKRVCCDARS